MGRLTRRVVVMQNEMCMIRFIMFLLIDAFTRLFCSASFENARPIFKVAQGKEPLKRKCFHAVLSMNRARGFIGVLCILMACCHSQEFHWERRQIE